MDNLAAGRRKNVSHIIPLALIGAGLIVLGLVAAKVITDNRSSGEYTVVPSAVNFPAPDLTLNDLQGERVSLSDYRDQIVLINNWATWCPPCRVEMPTLLRYFEQHSDQGFMLIGIEAGDPIDEVNRFVDEYDLTFPILLDPDNESLTAFHNDSLPSSYVINHSGNVVLAWTGPISYKMLDKYITPLLEQ